MTFSNRGRLLCSLPLSINAEEASIMAQGSAGRHKTAANRTGDGQEQILGSGGSVPEKFAWLQLLHGSNCCVPTCERIIFCKNGEPSPFAKAIPALNEVLWRRIAETANDSSCIRTLGRLEQCRGRQSAEHRPGRKASTVARASAAL